MGPNEGLLVHVVHHLLGVLAVRRATVQAEGEAVIFGKHVAPGEGGKGQYVLGKLTEVGAVSDPLGLVSATGLTVLRNQRYCQQNSTERLEEKLQRIVLGALQGSKATRHIYSRRLKNCRKPGAPTGVPIQFRRPKRPQNLGVLTRQRKACVCGPDHRVGNGEGGAFWAVLRAGIDGRGDPI